ncbi:hypothetical protein ACQKWADRAFT_323783 [Trichoderma austrokoningii]
MGRGKQQSAKSKKKAQQRSPPTESQAGPSKVLTIVELKTLPPKRPVHTPTASGDALGPRRRLPVAQTPSPHNTGNIRKHDEETFKILAIPKIRNLLPRAISERVQDVIDGARHGKRNLSQLSGLSLNASPPPAKQQMVEKNRERADAIIDSRLQSMEEHLAKANQLVTILNNEWHDGSLNITRNMFQSEIERLERLIAALNADIAVMRTSRHEISGRMMDDMAWQQDGQNTDWAYLDLLISRYKTPEGARISLFASRTSPAQERYRKKVMKAYDAEKKDLLWAAHIVGYNVGEPSVQHLFGPPDDRDGHSMSAKNGMPMYKEYEKAFDDARLVIVPDGDPETNCWKVWCLDDPNAHEASAMVPVGHELHGRSLQFLNDFRPRQRHDVPGWWRDYHISGSTENKMVWATPGSYLRTSTLRKLAHQIGHLTEEEAAAFAGGDRVELAEEDEEMDSTHSSVVSSAYSSQNSPTPASRKGKEVIR